MRRISLDSVARLLWALVLVTLPITSFRYVPFMGTGTYVRPLALYPLALLLPVLLVRLKQGRIARPWPGTATILVGFVLAVLAATSLGATFSPLELRGAGYDDRAIRALLSLGIGLAFFVAAVWMNQSAEEIKFSVKWLMVGMVFDLAWGAIQFVGLNTGYRQRLIKIQSIFSVRGLVQNKRASGFAFEPSWLAAQLAALYLPWLFASVLSRYHLTKFRWLEPLLLLGALAGVLITYSRSGLVVVAVAAFSTLLVAGRDRLSTGWGWMRAGFERERWGSRKAALRAAGIRMALAVLVLASMAGSIVFLANKGYISTFFQSQKDDVFSYVSAVYLGPRLAYSEAALDTFQQSPWLGVGLGASGFSIYKHMPDWVLAGQPEIAQQLSPDSLLYPNPKDLYARLLAETGLIGFALFLVFYLAVLADALGLLRGPDPAARWVAAAGLFALVAIGLQGFSQDSFAAPETWINLGIVAGAAGYWAKGHSLRETA